MLWQQSRCEAIHCELLTTVQALLGATRDFFARYNAKLGGVRSITGSTPQDLWHCT